jgi:hypothetical protein
MDHCQGKPGRIDIPPACRVPVDVQGPPSSPPRSVKVLQAEYPIFLDPPFRVVEKITATQIAKFTFITIP